MKKELVMMNNTPKIALLLGLLTYTTSMLNAASASPSNSQEETTANTNMSRRGCHSSIGSKTSCTSCFIVMKKRFGLNRLKDYNISPEQIILPPLPTPTPRCVANQDELRSFLISAIRHDLITVTRNDDDGMYKIANNLEFASAVIALFYKRSLHEAQSPFDILAALERGEDPNKLDEHGNTALHAMLASSHNFTPKDADEATKKAYCKKRANNIRLLLTHGADDNTRQSFDTGMTPLEHAAFYHNFEAVLMLAWYHGAGLTGSAEERLSRANSLPFSTEHCVNGNQRKNIIAVLTKFSNYDYYLQMQWLIE